MRRIILFLLATTVLCLAGCVPVLPPVESAAGTMPSATQETVTEPTMTDAPTEP